MRSLSEIAKAASGFQAAVDAAGVGRPGVAPITGLEAGALRYLARRPKNDPTAALSHVRESFPPQTRPPVRAMQMILHRLVERGLAGTNSLGWYHITEAGRTAVGLLPVMGR